MQFRIGVNLGDVIAEENNLYGSGVNVAVRLEQLAEAGGICISQTVYDQIRKIIEIPFEDIGERHLKNISEPVHVYRIRAAPLPSLRRFSSSAIRSGAGVWVLPQAAPFSYSSELRQRDCSICVSRLYYVTARWAAEPVFRQSRIRPLPFSPSTT